MGEVNPFRESLTRRTMSNITVISRSEKTDVSAKLVIENVVEEMKEAEPRSYVTSAIFAVQDTIFQPEWNFQLKMLLNHTEKDVQCISAFIINMSYHDVTLTNVCFELKAIPPNSTETVTLTKHRSPKMELSASGEESDGRGWRKAITHSKVKEACEEGDDLLFAFTAQLVGKQKKISSNSPLSSFNVARKRKCCAGGVLENVYKKMRDADFALLCDDESIPCHKIVLVGASPVFEAMIGNKKNKEAVEGEVDMDISAEVGRAFVEFIYTAKLDKKVLAKEAVSFLELGDKYQVPGLKELAEEEMMTQLSRENMVKLLAISDLYRAKELREAAIKFTKLNMSWVRSDETRMEEVKKLNVNLMAQLL